jgi:hypothetical protein
VVSASCTMVTASRCAIQGCSSAHTLAAIHGHARSCAGGQGGLPMDRAQTLAVASAAQLGAGVAGMVVALRRHGQPDAIARDTLFKGTALSARCPRWSPRQRWLPSWPVARVGPRRGGWASLASPWWPATWASGWCGNGFAHLVGTPWSRP